MKDSPDDRPRDDRTSTDDFETDQQVPQDAEWGVVAQVPFDPSESTGLTTTIVFAVADAEGVSPGDVKSPPLYEMVDTAALEAAFFGSNDESRAHDPHCSTEFMYRGYRVVVRSDGWVIVNEQVTK